MGSKDDVPEFIGDPRYEADGKELVAKIRLVPGKTYRFGLNSPTVTGFAAADGTPLEPVEVTFSVKKE
jgi:hypothetical protein